MRRAPPRGPWPESPVPPSRPLKGAHLLRWRPRQQAQRTESTPHLLPSGAASHLNPFERPAPLLPEAAGVRGLGSSTLVQRARARIGAFAELSRFGIVPPVSVSAAARCRLSG